MTRDELEHAIRAACDVAHETEVYVFGSQAVLGQFPDAPPSLRQSAEADVFPKNKPDRVDAIDAMRGELSQFHRTHGFYVRRDRRSRGPGVRAYHSRLHRMRLTPSRNWSRVRVLSTRQPCSHCFEPVMATARRSRAATNRWSGRLPR